MMTKNNGRSDSVENTQLETAREAAMNQISACTFGGTGEQLIEELVGAMAAYEEVEPMLLTLEDRDLRRVRINPVNAARTAIAAVPRIEAFRERLAELPKSEVADLDVLPKLAHAVLLLQGRVSGGAGPSVRELVETCIEHREKMVVGAMPLAHAGLMDDRRLASLGRRHGYLDVGNDLTWLADLYRGAWPKVHGKTLVTLADVHLAAELGDRLVNAVLVRDPEAEEPTGPDPKQLLARAVTLLYGCYGRLRDAVRYLTGSDAETAEVMPSLRGRKRKAGAAKAGEPKVVKPEVPEAAATETAVSGAAPAVTVPVELAGQPAAETAPVTEAAEQPPDDSG